jgi:phosphatidylglycerophosphatase A
LDESALSTIFPFPWQLELHSEYGALYAAATKYPTQTQIQDCHQERPSTIIEEEIIHVFCIVLYLVDPERRQWKWINFIAFWIADSLNIVSVSKCTKAAATKYPTQTQIQDCHQERPSTIIEEEIIHVFIAFWIADSLNIVSVSKWCPVQA